MCSHHARREEQFRKPGIPVAGITRIDNEAHNLSQSQLVPTLSHIFSHIQQSLDTNHASTAAAHWVRQQLLLSPNTEVLYYVRPAMTGEEE